jgi:Homeodomain-like domain
MLAATKEGWAMPKKYVVRLSDAEREMLAGLLKKKRVSAQKVRRARILLKADADGPNWTDAKIADAFDCRTHSVECLRERLVTEGFEIAVHGQPKSRVRGKVLDGAQEAKIIALRLGPPPKGFANWTLRLLAAQAVTLEIVESVSHETLRRTLKKTR